MPFDPKEIKLFPTLSGVYLMKDKGEKILYIGKAKNLRLRVSQYFVPGRDGREMVPFLTPQIETIDTIVVTSEKEALILENNLIKTHQPKYNALLKDDKTYFSLMINHKHMWPMIRVVRYKGKPPSGNLYFGPYTKGHAARETLEVLRHLFPLRQCSDRELVSRTRPCILYELKRCIAPCVAKCTKEEYDRDVKRVVDFLKGHDAIILKELRAEMEKASEALEFEKAARIYTTIEYIEETLERQKVQKAGAEDLDVLGIYRQGDRVVLTQLLFREGKLLASNHHIFNHNAQEDDELFSSFILQHYGEMEELPHAILLPIELEEQETLSSLISANKKRKTAIQFPLKGNKKELLKMAHMNAEARFKREKEAKDLKEQILISMEEQFQLTNYPERIECFDHSNISGSEPVSAMVVYTAGEKDRKRYRKYKIKSAGPSDDYGALKEVLNRRYKQAKEEDDLPDLIIIDGGKGHLNLAYEVLSSLDISTVDIIGVAKQEGLHTRGMTEEQVYLRGEKHPLLLKHNSQLLFFIQQVRDEAHRFAITFHRERRNKRSLSSELDTIPGIGPVKKERLLSHFGSLKRILDGSPDQWKEIKGITKKDIETLIELKNQKKNK